jgi:integrase/recombinase XerD
MNYISTVESFLNSLRAKRRSPDTITWYSEQFAAFSAWRAGRRLDLPDADEIEAFLADQNDRPDLAPSTVNARYRALRALFLWCERRRGLRHDDNPIHLIDPPTVPKEIRSYVDKRTFDALLRSIPPLTWLDQRDRLILLLLYYCGLRRGELINLHVADANTTTLELTVRKGKRGKSRIVPFTEAIRLELIAYLFVRPNHTDVLLLKSDGYGHADGSLAGEGVRQMLRRRCADAGIPAYSPHKFRHGFAMWTLNAGVRMEIVSSLMGHADIAVTSQVYAFTLTSTERYEYDLAVKRLNG